MRLTKERLNAVAAGLVFLAFVLLVWGLQSAGWMWRVGLGLTALAYLIALGTQWVAEGVQEGEEEDDEEGGGDGDGEEEGGDERA